jgi:hypothetical protein
MPSRAEVSPQRVKMQRCAEWMSIAQPEAGSQSAHHRSAADSVKPARRHWNAGLLSLQPQRMREPTKGSHGYQSNHLGPGRHGRQALHPRPARDGGNPARPHGHRRQPRAHPLRLPLPPARRPRRRARVCRLPNRPRLSSTVTIRRRSLAPLAGPRRTTNDASARSIGRSAYLSIWSFAVFGGLRGQVGGVLAGFAALRANPTDNPETPARAASGNARTRKLQLSMTWRILGICSSPISWI